MAWPANGTTDWNTKSAAYVAVEHNTNGTHNIYDTEGGYQTADVDGTATKVYTKYLTGTTDSDSATNVAHGLTYGNILSVFVVIESSDNIYGVSAYKVEASATAAFAISYNATNIIIADVGSARQGEAYRIKIEYTI